MVLGSFLSRFDRIDEVGKTVISQFYKSDPGSSLRPVDGLELQNYNVAKESMEPEGRWQCVQGGGSASLGDWVVIETGEEVKIRTNYVFPANCATVREE